MPVFTRRHRMPVSAEALFAWHERPGAFERLNPPWEPVHVVARSGGIRDGARVTVRVPIGPAGISWTLEHRDYVAGRQFRDVQVQGPFATWEHTHTVEPDGADASVLEDHIVYEATFRWAGGALVESALALSLARLFAYRHALTEGDLSRHAAYAGPPMRIAITGATGFIGSALDAFLTTGGHAVHRVVRGAPDATRPNADIVWDPSRGTIDAAALEGMDAVVHLAGASVAERWTPAHRRAVMESRVLGTSLMARTLAGLTAKPSVFVSASAVGWYGDRGDEILDETSTAGRGYLPDVARAWEDAAAPAKDAGIRVVHPRTGVVLGAAGGALGKQLPIFQLCLGGPLGSGRHWLPWIALDDMLGAMLHVLRRPVQGPVNFVGPAPVTNAEFTRTLGRVLHRPAVVPVPPMALRLVFGREMADAVLLSSTRAMPQVLDASGFAFRHPTLEHALQFELGRLPL
jgi:uncharacterized protein